MSNADNSERPTWRRRDTGFLYRETNTGLIYRGHHGWMPSAYGSVQEMRSIGIQLDKR